MNLNKTESNIWEHHIGAFYFKKLLTLGLIACMIQLLKQDNLPH